MFKSDQKTAKLCQHCGEPIPVHTAGNFCCIGCEGAYNFIQESGLSGYYEHQQLSKNARSLVPEDVPDIHWFVPFITQDDGLSKIHLMIEGIHCAACVWLIEQTLRRMPFISHVRLNMGTRRLTLAWRGDNTHLQPYLEAIYKLGYKAMPFDPLILKSEQKKEEKQLLINMAVSGFAAGNLMTYSISLWSGAEMSSATQAFFTWLVAMIALPTIAYAGRPFFRSAYRALKTKRINMDVPIALAIITATCLSIFEMLYGRETYFDGCVTLVFFLSIGRYLDTLMRGKSRQYAEDLLLLDQSMATRRLVDGSFEIVPIKQLKLGDVITFAKGEKLGADVQVLEGHSAVDTSALTGESLPESVSVGSLLGAGYVNLQNPLVCKVVATGEKSALYRLVQMIEESEAVQNVYTRWADKAAQIYAPTVHLLALLSAIFWLFMGQGWYFAILTAVTVLIVTCPCAFALAVPSAMAASNSRLRQQGILLKNGDVLEKTPIIEHIIFDKTGTLTTGELIVEKIQPKDLAIACALASYSSHPLAKMLLLSTKDISVPSLENVQEFTGKGVQGLYNGQVIKLGSSSFCETEGTGLFLRIGSRVQHLNFTDKLKGGAAEAVARLVKQGYTLHLLTGDGKPLSDEMKNLPFHYIKTGASPEEKHDYIKKLDYVMMVGDGLNDAPALAQSDVAVSFGKATALAQNSADVIFCRDDLLSLMDYLKTANQTKRVVVQNFAFSVSYNFIAVPMAMFGLMTPMWAAVFMSASSLVVVLNALRLKRI